MQVIMLNMSDQLKSKLDWATSRKPFIYRCLNIIVSSLATNDKVPSPLSLIQSWERADDAGDPPRPRPA